MSLTVIQDDFSIPLIYSQRLKIRCMCLCHAIVEQAICMSDNPTLDVKTCSHFIYRLLTPDVG